MTAEDSLPCRVSICGVPVTPLRLPQLLDAVCRWVDLSSRATVFYVNVHCMNVAEDNPTFRDTLRGADVVYCDGTGVRLAAHLLGRRIPERMTGADWIHDLCRRCVEARMSLFLLGGEEGVADEAAGVLRRRYPGLNVVGTHGGYGLSRSVIDDINASQPDILLVGMGTPRQEFWIEQHRDELHVPVVWAVGALFSFVAGRIPRGPRWMTNHGLEWLCRLAAEPRKLWRRYLVGNPRFFGHVLRCWVRQRTGF